MIDAGATARLVSRAAEFLREGELVAFPTETVYGLGADASNPQAVAKIFAAKGRPPDHPLIVHLPESSYLAQWAIDIPEAAKQLAAEFWPGPLTLILKRNTGVPDAVTGGQDTVGLRVPDHPLALALLREFKGGIAAPSANRFGHLSPTTAAHVASELGGAVAMILDGGACKVGIESTIVDLSRGTPRILRPGMIETAHIARVIGDVHDSAINQSEVVPRVSGSLDAHYAPRTPMQMVPADELFPAVFAAIADGKRLAVLASISAPESLDELVWRTASSSSTDFARALYAELHALDALSCDLILVQQPPETSPWLAVSDRLRRAVAGSGRI